MDNKRKRYTPKTFLEKVNELIGILCSREGSEGGDATTSLYETLKRAPRGSLEQYGFLLQEGQPQPADEILYVKQKLSGATMLPSITFKYNNAEIDITGFLLYDHNQGKGRKVKIKSGGLNSSSLKVNVGMGFFTSSYDVTFIIFGKKKVFEDLSEFSDENEITNSTNIEALKGIKQDENEEHINSLDEPTHSINEQERTGVSGELAKAEVHSEPNNVNITYYEENPTNADEIMGTPEDEDKQVPASIEEFNVTADDTEFTEGVTNSPKDEDEQVSRPVEKSTLTADDIENTDAVANLSKNVDKQVSTLIDDPNLAVNDIKNTPAVASLPKDEDIQASTSLEEPTFAVDDHENTEAVENIPKDEDKQVSAPVEESTLTADNRESTKILASLPKDEDKQVLAPVEKSTLTADGELNEVKDDLSKDKIDKGPSSNKNKKTFLNISYL